MKSSIKIWILSTAVWAFGPVSNALAQTKPGITVAQYRLLSKGEPAPYTGVIIGLETYRAETAKFDAQADLIVGLKSELADTQQLLVLQRNETDKTQQKLNAQTELAASAQTTVAEVNTSLQTTQAAYEKAKPKFYQKPLFLLATGFIGGCYIGFKVAQ